MNRFVRLLFVALIGVLAITDVQAKEVTQIGRVKAIVTDPTEPQTLFLGTSSGLFRVSNIVKKAKIEQIGFEGIEVNCLLFDPLESKKTLYVGTFAYGLFRLTADGKHWRGDQISEVEIGGINHLLFDLQEPKTMYVVSNRHVYSATAVPRQFIPLSDLPGDIIVHKLLLDPAVPEKMRLKGYNSAFYFSTDQGKNWESDPSISTYLHSWNIAADYTSMSANENQETEVCWRALSALISDAFTEFLFDPRDSTTLYISTFANGIYKVSRKVTTWKVMEISHFSLKSIYSMLITSYEPLKIFVGVTDNVLYTEDGGNTWKSILPSTEGKK